MQLSEVEHAQPLIPFSLLARGTGSRTGIPTGGRRLRSVCGVDGVTPVDELVPEEAGGRSARIRLAGHDQNRERLSTNLTRLEKVGAGRVC